MESPPQEPLRVLFLTTYFPRPLNPLLGPWALSQAHALARNGADVQVVSMNPWLPRWIARSQGARAYAFAPPSYAWDGLQVEYPRWLYYPFNSVKRWTNIAPGLALWIGWRSGRKALLKAVQTHHPHIIYAHHTLVNGYLALQLHKRLDIPFVVTDHDFGEIASSEANPRVHKLFSAVARDAGCMVGVSKRMSDQVRQLFPFARTQTVYNGTDAIPESVRQKPRPPELQGRQILFAAAMFYERKGLPLLVRAFAKVSGKYPDAVLRIAGDGQERPAIEKAIADTNMQNRVKLLGLQPRETVLQEMTWCDCFTLIGWDEPGAIVFAEAMSASRPIICANDGGMAETLQDGVQAYLVPPRDLDSAAAAIGKILADPNARARMGAAARELFDTQLNWDANAKTMIRIFRDAIGQSPSKA